MLGKRLARAREAAGFTQAQLAHAIGVGQQTVSMIESGRRNPSLANLVRLASLLNVTTDYLLELSGDNSSAIEGIDGVFEMPDGTSLTVQWKAGVVRVPTVEESRLIEMADRTVARTDEEAFPLPLSVIHELSVDLEAARMFKVHGTTMDPTLPDGSVILVDTRSKELRDNRLYVFSHGESLLVKRARQQGEDRFWWFNDNSLWWPVSHSHEIEIWGQVRWVGFVLPP